MVGRQTDPHQCGGKYKKKCIFEKNVTKIASLRYFDKVLNS